MKTKLIVSQILIFLMVFSASAQTPLQGQQPPAQGQPITPQYNYATDTNIHYYDNAINEANEYINDLCVLDVYYPTDTKEKVATIVWFHGGGLLAGMKEIPDALKKRGFIVVGVGYRLSPNVTAPKYIEDAAAATAWVFKNINKKYNGDPNLIFVSGHSAGGYLTLMIGLDKKYLEAFDVDANDIAGLIPFSPHTVTHFTVRKEKGIPDTQPIIDEYAPLYHCRADASPILLITGGREIELLGRYEENAYMDRMMKINGHTETKLYELDGFNHRTMPNPAYFLLLDEVQRITKLKQKK